ncbi:MAG: MFS transporter [Pseudomonadota bacterium]
MTLAFGTRQPCDNLVQDLDRTACDKSQKRWVLCISVLGSSLAFIEGSIVNLALPALQQDLELGALSLQWVVTAYLLALSSLILIGGAAGDRFGLKPVFLFGLGLFGLASALCAMATDPTHLIAARTIQGAGAAFLVPTSLALISVYFEPAERAQAIGVWAGASALTTAAAPLLGGLLVDAFGWQAVFWLIAPFAATACMLGGWRIPSRPITRLGGSLDWLGAALLAPSFALLTYGFAAEGTGTIHGGYIGFGLTLLALFAFHEHRSSSPMMPLTLFKSRIFRGANLVTLLLYFSIGGAFYFIPFNLIQVQGYSALQAGAAFLPMTLLIGFGSSPMAKLATQMTPRTLLTAGAALTCGGLVLLAFPSSETTYLRHWLPGITIVGVGMTLSVSPLTTVVMTSVDEQQSGTASGINNTAARMAGMLATAALTAVAVTLFSASLDEALAGLATDPDTRTRLMASAAELAELSVPPDFASGSAIAAAIDQSYLYAYRIVVLICAAAAAGAAAAAWVSLPTAKR